MDNASKFKKETMTIDEWLGSFRNTKLYEYIPFQILEHIVSWNTFQKHMHHSIKAYNYLDNFFEFEKPIKTINE